MADNSTEEITVEQALEKLDQIAKEWVKKDLDKGIPISFRYWPAGCYKHALTLILWQGILVPIIFGLIVFACAMMKEWKIFVILLICYVIYWIIGALLMRREKGSFILRTDGITVITPRKKMFIPWNVVTDVSSSIEDGVVSIESKAVQQYKAKYNNVYELVILTQNKSYSFYEVYVGALAKDSGGQINPVMMPLHVAYKLIKTAHEKVKNM